MLLIFSLFLFAIFQEIIITQVQGIKHGPNDDPPEKYYITHEAWFNISVRENKLSSAPVRTDRIVIGLFGEICPMTVTNFVTITKGLRRATVSSGNNIRRLHHCI
jgi:hypothetical protein